MHTDMVLSTGSTERLRRVDPSRKTNERYRNLQGRVWGVGNNPTPHKLEPTISDEPG